jgi:hypothetical protein
MSKGGGSVVVFAGNLVEADLVKSLLDDAGINSFLKDEILGLTRSEILDFIQEGRRSF